MDNLNKRFIAQPDESTQNRNDSIYALDTSMGSILIVLLSNRRISMEKNNSKNGEQLNSRSVTTSCERRTQTNTFFFLQFAFRSPETFNKHRRRKIVFMKNGKSSFADPSDEASSRKKGKDKKNHHHQRRTSTNDDADHYYCMRL